MSTPRTLADLPAPDPVTVRRLLAALVGAQNGGEADAAA